MHNYSQTVVSLMALRPGRIGIWKCWFLWRKENRTIRRKTLGARTRTNNKLNPHGTGNRTRATLVEGECSHHCAIPAPLICNINSLVPRDQWSVRARETLYVLPTVPLNGEDRGRCKRIEFSMFSPLSKNGWVLDSTLNSDVTDRG